MLDVTGDSFSMEDQLALAEAQRTHAVELERKLSSGEEIPEGTALLLAERYRLHQLFEDAVLLAASAKMRMHEIDNTLEEQLGANKNVIFQSFARLVEARRQPFFSFVTRFHK